MDLDSLSITLGFTVLNDDSQCFVGNRLTNRNFYTFDPTRSPSMIFWCRHARERDFFLYAPMIVFYMCVFLPDGWIPDYWVYLYLGDHGI